MSHSDMGIDKKRRQCIKAVGGAAGITALAGCGGGDDTDTPTEGTGNGTSTGTSGFSGVTVEYWDQHNVNSQPVRDGMEQKVQEFEDSTGANMDVNWSDQGSVADGTWLQNMRAGEIPHLYSSSAAITGQFHTNGITRDATEYIDQFSQDFRDNIEFSRNRMESVYNGYDADFLEIPISQLPNNPFVIRQDHADEAGIDLESDFPPENYEQLLQVAQTLQEDGPSNFGMQVHGAQGDVTDEITVVWSVAEGGHEGNYIDEDWSDVNYDNEFWVDAFEKQVELFREHGLSDQGTPTSSDERATRLVQSGDASMSQINAQNFALFLDEAPELVDNGQIRFGQAWEGEAGYAGTGFIATFALCNPPDGADEDQWETAQDAAVPFMESFLSADWQTEWAELFGHVPAREDVWDDVAERMTNEEEVRFGESIMSTADKLGPAWPAHPELAFVKAQAPGPELQKALRGEISAEQALTNAAETVRNQTSLGS